MIRLAPSAERVPHSRIRELAELTLELTGSRSRLNFLPLPQDDPRQRRPDITKAQKHLGWRPKIALREGLDRTIEYFDRVLTAGRATRQTARQARSLHGAEAARV